MLIDFFLKLKSHRLPVSIKEYLTLLEAMNKGVIGPSVDEFYYLSRSALVKDEANFDKFDRAFAEFWQGVETIPGIETQVPLEWLLKQVELTLSEEEKKQIEALGGWEKLMETLKQRLEEQKGRHQGGAKWIGTAGTSPFGAYGYNPEGVRIGQERSRNRSAVKVWDQREYRNLDDSVELGTRNIKVALRRLRKFAREGAPEEFDLENTIQSTARKAYLDIHMRPERRNAIKVLMLMDIGGTMDDHVKLAAELFSAAKTSSSTSSSSISTTACMTSCGRTTAGAAPSAPVPGTDRKSTRLNSRHSQISYAVFCLKKKKTNHNIICFL